MLKLNNFDREFILDLNKKPNDEHTFTITSKGEANNPLPWGIEYVSDNSVIVNKNGDTLSVQLDHKKLVSEITISLKNYKKERLILKIKPTLEALEDKTYKFGISDRNIDNGVLKVVVESTVNNRKQPWKMTYSGDPLTYDFIINDNELEIILLTELISEFKTKIVLFQEDSENEIELNLLNDKGGIKKLINR
jgi:hypothetical protein